MSKITALSVRDFKRLSTVEIEPGARQLVIIGGSNAAGKSSTLDAITAALVGKKAMPEVPIRDGEDKAEIVVTLDSGVTIKRTVTRKDGGSLGGSLTIRTADGMSPRGAQGWLNGQLGAMTCDPMAFLALDAKAQATTLREIAGIDTTVIEERRKLAYNQRTEVGRDKRRVEGQLASMPSFPDAPEVAPEAEEVSAVDLLAEIEAADETKRAAERAEAERIRAVGVLQSGDERLADLRHIVVDLEERLKAAREAVGRQELGMAALQREVDKAASAAIDAEAAVIDAAPLRERLASIEDDNRKAREAAKVIADQVAANEARAKVADELAGHVNAYDSLTAQIEQHDAEKAEALDRAAMPVDGLGIDDEGRITFGGMVLSQASRAQQIRVSMALALAGAPDDGIRVALIRDASLLDDDSMGLISAAAEEMNAQVWLERVGDRDDGVIVIEDGTVRSA